MQGIACIPVTVANRSYHLTDLDSFNLPQNFIPFENKVLNLPLYIEFAAKTTATLSLYLFLFSVQYHEAINQSLIKKVFHLFLRHADQFVHEEHQIQNRTVEDMVKLKKKILN